MPRGGHIDLEKWRRDHWKPALVAASIPHRRIYDLRHTYATWSLAAGVSLQRVALHGDLTMLARLSPALARARAVSFAA